MLGLYFWCWSVVCWIFEVVVVFGVWKCCCLLVLCGVGCFVLMWCVVVIWWWVMWWGWGLSSCEVGVVV